MTPTRRRRSGAWSRWTLWGLGRLAGGIGRDRMTGAMSFAARIARTVCAGRPLRIPRSTYPAIRTVSAGQLRPSLRSM